MRRCGCRREGQCQRCSFDRERREGCSPNQVETIVEPTVYCTVEKKHHHHIRHIVPVVQREIHHHHRHHEYVVERDFQREDREHEHGRQDNRDWCAEGEGACGGNHDRMRCQDDEGNDVVAYNEAELCDEATVCDETTAYDEVDVYNGFGADEVESD